MATIRKRGERWQAQVRKKGSRAVSRSFATKAAAQTWARETERAIERREFQPDPLPPLGELIARYRAEMPPPGRTKDAVLRMLEAELGDAVIDKPTVIRYAEKRAREHGAGPATISQDLIYLRGVLSAARAHWDLPADVAVVDDARVVLSARGLVGRSRERDRRVTPEELDQLRAYFESPRRRNAAIPMWALVQFAIASCMRLGEICRIRWADVDETDRTVVIQARKDPRQPRDHTVPLLGEAWTLVQAQPRSAPEIFPYNPRTVSTLFTRTVQRLGIPDLRFHDMRHEGISRLFEQGYGVPQVALVSGHRTWTQLRRYTTLKAKDLHALDRNGE